MCGIKREESSLPTVHRRNHPAYQPSSLDVVDKYNQKPRNTSRNQGTNMNQQAVPKENKSMVFTKKSKRTSPGLVAQLDRVLSQFAKVVGSIPSQGTCKNQPVDTPVSATTDRCVCLSLSLPSSLPLPHFLSFSLKSISKNLRKKNHQENV